MNLRLNLWWVFDGIFQCVPKIHDPREILDKARRSRLENIRLPRIFSCSSSSSLHNQRISLAKFGLFFRRLFFLIACVIAVIDFLAKKKILDCVILKKIIRNNYIYIIYIYNYIIIKIIRLTLNHIFLFFVLMSRTREWCAIWYQVCS